MENSEKDPRGLIPGGVCVAGGGWKTDESELDRFLLDTPTSKSLRLPLRVPKQ